MSIFSSELMRNLCTFQVGIARNGFIFGEYDISTDEYKTIIASTPEELGEVILQWQTDRLPSIVEWARKKSAELNGH